MQGEREVSLDTCARGIRKRRTFWTKNLISVGRAIKTHVVHEETRLDVELFHALDLIGPRHRRMFDAVDPVGR